MTIFLWDKSNGKYSEMFFITEPDSILLDLDTMSTCFSYRDAGTTHIRKPVHIKRAQYANDCLVISEHGEL